MYIINYYYIYILLILCILLLYSIYKYQILYYIINGLPPVVLKLKNKRVFFKFEKHTNNGF